MSRWRTLASCGARPTGLLVTILCRSLTASTAGMVIGGVAAFALGRTLEALLHGVRSSDALSFMAAAAALLTVSAIAAFVPARRAARVDPARVLRAD
jgi:putative ABC transport system permease protein